MMPTPLVQINGRPNMDYLMDKISEISWIDEVLVCVNRRSEQQFKDWAIARKHDKVKLLIENTVNGQRGLGAIATMAAALPHLEEQDCLVVGGDNFFTSSLKGFLDFHYRTGATVVGVYVVAETGLSRRYSVVDIDREHRLMRFIEKPSRPDSNVVATCIYAMPYWTLSMVKDYLAEGNNGFAPGYFIQWLHTAVDVYGYILGGLWYDIGTNDTYEMAKKDFAWWVERLQSPPYTQ